MSTPHSLLTLSCLFPPITLLKNEQGVNKILRQGGVKIGVTLDGVYQACTTFALRIFKAKLLILLVAVQGFEPRTLEFTEFCRGCQ